jgi:hypothetical protein
LTRDFAAAEERARLAAFDLTAAANEVIRRRSISWLNAGTEADDAEASRWPRYLQRWFPDDARDCLGIASRAQTEVATIVAVRQRAVEAGGGASAAASDDAGSIKRLEALADDCERWAIRLRS